LSIGYATCHWCHVMEHESFRDQDIANLMNEHFVSIKVDREERPDIDEIYMTATMALTGHGGWPMTVFLTPNHDAFFAGTYFPPDDHDSRPGFKSVLRGIAEVWRNDRQRVESEGIRITEYLRSLVAPKEPQTLPDTLVESAILQLRADFDERWGGFGGAPKFPPHASLRLLAHSYLRNRAENCLEMITTTLDRIQQGGIHDHLAGGFARYSTDNTWHVPHFEKMLYDNAQLAKAYLIAYRLTKNDAYRTTLEGIFDWVQTEMTSPEGGFYTGLDADSEGEEGRYYVFTWSEIQEALPSDQADIVCHYFDIRPEGNWEGSNVLRRLRSIAELANDLGVDEPTLLSQLSQAKRKLLELRSSRPRPLTDDKVLAGQTGLMLGAYAEAGRVLSKPEYVDIAKRAAEFVRDHMLEESGRLCRATRGGKSGQPAMLEDYAFLADGLVDLYEATGIARYLLAADSLARRMLDDFYDEQAGRLHNSPLEHEELLFRVAEAHDGPTPNATASAAHVLTRLSLLLGRSAWREVGQTLLRAHGKAATTFPRGHCDLLRTAQAARDFYTIIAIIPGTDEAANEAIWRACAEECRYSTLLSLLPSNPGPEELALPLFAGRLHNQAEPHVYVCRDDYCSMPVHTVADLQRQLSLPNQL